MALGKTNAGGGGGTGGTLVVTAPVGVTVTATNSTLGKTYTRVTNYEGKATFKGLASGTWAINMTDGSQTTNPVQVVVNSDYTIKLSFFSATINVTYPAGSTCKASDGVTTLTAPDATGTWNITVPNAGTWTIKCYDGVDYDSSEKKKSAEVEITDEGQSVSVKLSYELVLFNAGEGKENWVSQTGDHGTPTISNVLSVYTPANVAYGSSSYASISTVNPIQFSDYDELVINVTEFEAIHETYGHGEISIYIGTKQYGSNVSSIDVDQTGEIRIDVSNYTLTSGYYITLYVVQTASIQGSQLAGFTVNSIVCK